MCLCSYRTEVITKYNYIQKYEAQYVPENGQL